ncbi:MAG: DUF4272 domain-containing protein [Planctomycetota bacterium]
MEHDEHGTPDENVAPPTMERVIARARVLAAVAKRAHLDGIRKQVDDPQLQRERILAWVHSTGISYEVEPDELTLLELPIGKLNLRQIRYSWRIEGVGVLVWALGVGEFPADQQLCKHGLLEALGAFDDNSTAIPLEERARMQPVEALVDRQLHMLNLHWRLRDLHANPRHYDFVEGCRNSWLGPIDAESHYEIVDRDLAIDSVPVFYADLDRVAQVTAAVAERHIAINWLMGHHRLYSAVGNDT